MTHLPASVLALATTLSLAAGVAEAKPHRARPRPPAARPLLRATPAPEEHRSWVLSPTACSASSHRKPSR